MSEEHAIRYYGAMYDDPLQSIGRTKYKPLIRAIYNYCKAHDTREFVFSDLPPEIQQEFSPKSLVAAAARQCAPIMQTKTKVKNRAGTTKVFVWRFMMPF